VAERRLPVPAVIVATALALVATLGVLAVIDTGGDDGGASAPDEAGDGYELAPAGELPDSVAAVRLVSLDGGAERALGELLGTTPVVINFFGSWCAPCVDEMPAFEAVHQTLGDQVTFIGLANDDSTANALDTVAATGVTYPTFDDPAASALTYFGGLAMPTTVFIDTSGEVVDVNSGPMREAELRARITDLFGVAA
jgi:cytochrome c-type biogenesis protein